MSASQRLNQLAWLLPLGCFWAVLIYQLGAQWSAFEQYSYGWAVPVVCACLMVRKRRSKPGDTSDHQTMDDGQHREDVEPSRFYLPSSIRYRLLLVAALAYAPIRFLHEANPIWRLTSLGLALDVIGITLLCLACGRWSRRLVVCWFPLCFFLVAVPWPSALESFVTQSLRRLDVAGTVELLGWLGIPALHHGNAIEVGSGVVGIDDACSGVRSFQATLMIALFFGEIYRFTVVRRVGLCLLGFVLAFVFNVGRTTLLSWVAATKGTAAMATWHDPAGVAILLGCFLCLWVGARVTRRGQRTEVRNQRSANGRDSGTTDFGLQGSGLPTTDYAWSRGLVLPWSLVAWFIVVEVGTEFWYRAHEKAVANEAEWSVRTDQLGASCIRIEIPQLVASQFCADESLHASWQDGEDNMWQLYYFRWHPARQLKRRVAAQLGKIHGPEVCLPAAGITMKADLGTILLPLPGMELALQQFLFGVEGRPLHVFYAVYEDQSGSAVLANRRKDWRSRVASALAGSRNCGQRFLELAVFGPAEPLEARTALQGQLQKLIRREQKSEVRDQRTERHRMRINSAKELEVYKKAYELAMRIYQISKQFPPEEKFALTGQIRRSSRSVCMNLREAWAKRRYEAHFVSKLTDSDGENSETETSLDFAKSCDYIGPEEHQMLASLAHEVGKMLGSMIKNPRLLTSAL